MTEKFYPEKTAVVTGASSGIGRAIAQELVKRGSNVVVTGRNRERLKLLTEECKGLLGKCLSISADIRDSRAGKQITELALGLNGRIDLLIHNASLGFYAPAVETPIDVTREIIDTNLLGTINLNQEVVQAMTSQQDGHVVFVTSLAGKMGFPGLAAYSASKFGVEGFAEAIRPELTQSNIGVTVFRPGVTNTGFFDTAGMQDYATAMQRQGKMHPPETAARFLLDKLPHKPNELTFGPDALFVRLLPFIPSTLRLKVLSLIG